MERSKQIRYFLFSQYFSDGVRITLEIIIPALVFSYLGQLETGLSLSLGALCVSISDGPGPVVHKRNGMLFCNLFIFISALLTGFLNHNPVTLGILILLASFFFTMFSVYGNRATSVGFAALLIMILQMTQMIPPSLVLKESLLILSGGIWYMLVALLFFRLTPYRPAKRSIAECLKETAKYLLIKAEMYNTRSDLQQEYLRLLDQQVVVNESQNAARELLYKNRALLKESTLTGRMLVFTFVDSVDLFEHIMATGYDYEDMRKRYADTNVLNDVSEIIKKLADELNNIGDAIQFNSSYLIKYNFQEEVDFLKEKIHEISVKHDTQLLEKILINLGNLSEKIDSILNYFKEEEAGEKRKLRTSREYSRFVSQQDISWKVFKNNLTLKSSIFRHSLRVMITCGAGYVVSKFLPHEHHSYWIVMTIIIILKPAFSLTKQKNADRLLGTIGGGIIGLLLLYFIHDKVILFGLLVFFMLGTYTFKIMNYIVMVIFLTPYILILFHFLGLGALNVASERLLDTTIGSVLAALGSYFLFPVWESSQLQTYMCNVLEANIHYLEKLRDLFSKNKISTLDYKVVRKDLFVSTANLASALHRMQSEPKNKQKHKNEIYEFVVLNNLLSSNIASLTSELMKDPSVASNEVSLQVENLIMILKETLKKLDNKPGIENENVLVSKFSSTGKIIQNKWRSQFEFISKLVLDIQKVTNIVAS
ncbi:MAG: FUSC family membrane protein [Ginsengibacter sp.]